MSTLAPAPEPGARPEPSLTQRVETAFLWRLATVVLKFVLRLTVLVVLARLVPVEAFGLVALAMIVIGFASRFSELGMVPALIQRKDLSATHVRVAFTISLLVGLLLTALTWASAPLAATLLRQPEVEPLLRLVAVVFLLSSLGTTAGAMLQRRLAFRQYSAADFVSYMVGYGGVGIGLALAGHGAWAIAWAEVALAGTRAAMLLVLSPHPVRPCLARSEARQLLGFGTGETLGRLATYAAHHGDYFVVGRWLGASALGLYSRAYQLMLLPIYEFSSILESVLFPAYAEIQEESERLRRAYLSATSLTALITAPVLMTLAVSAPELVTGVFGAQWAGAVVPLQVLCVGGVFRTYGMSDSLVRARGAVYARLWRHAVYGVAVVGGALYASRWGIEAVAVAVVGAILLVYLLMAQLSLRLLGARWVELGRALRPGLLVALGAALTGHAAATLLRALELHALACLALLGLVGATSAVVLALLLPPSWHDAGVVSLAARASARIEALRARVTLARNLA